MPLFQTIFQPMMTIKGVKVNPDARRFSLKATGGGLIANLLGMGTRASLTVDETGFRLQKTAFGTDERVYIPASQIASTIHIIMKPVEFLVLGLVTLPIGLGLIFLIAYFLSNKRVIVGVASTGGTVESVKLKVSNSVLEDIEEGMSTLEDLIRERSAAASSSDVPAERPAAPVSEPRRPKPAPVSDPAAPRVIPCPSCGTRMSIPPEVAGRKVRCGSCREVFPVPAAGE